VLRNPEAAQVFAAMVEHTQNAAPALRSDHLAVIQADIAVAFRAAFLLMAGFTLTGFFLALTNPMRRI
jgi:hypothetical protein